jgi:hypothetical protein
MKKEMSYEMSVEDRKIISELAHIGLDELRIRGFDPWTEAVAVLSDFDSGLVAVDFAKHSEDW